jgi:hypothetical protein
MIDFAVVLLLLGFVLWGFLHGAVFNVLGLAAFLLAYFLSAPLAGPFVGLIVGRLAWSPGVAYLTARLVLCVVIYLPLSMFVSRVDRRFRESKSETLLAVNSGVGAACGLAWGMLAAFFLLCIADVWVKALPEANGPFARSVRTSYFRGLVSASNPADRFLVTDVLKLLRAARQDPQVLERLSANPHVRKLLEHPDLQAVLEDDELSKKLRDDPIGTILHDRGLGRLLADKELRRMILSVEMQEALRQAMAEQSARGAQ